MNYEKTIKIIIDFGVKYTKIGLGDDSEPRKIIPSPPLFNLPEYFNSEKTNFNIMHYFNDSQESKLLIEEMAYKIINDYLQIRKPERQKVNCYILFDLELKERFREIYLTFMKYLYETFSFINSLIIIPKNICPVFVTGSCSGLILNCGFMFSTITVVDNGISIYNKNIGLGMCNLQKHYYKLILNDEKGLDKIPPEKRDLFKENLPKHIDNILITSSYVLNKNISIEWKNNMEKYKDDYNNNSYIYYPNLPKFKLSFNTRVSVGEVLFAENSEDNLAYNILKTITYNVPCEIRKKISSNIILSGGMTMLFGFYQRMVDELNYLIDIPEFDVIYETKSDINVHKIIFPRNCLSWIGASLLLNLRDLNFAGNQITRKEKKSKKDNADVNDNDQENDIDYLLRDLLENCKK